MRKTSVQIIFYGSLLLIFTFAIVVMFSVQAYATGPVRNTPTGTTDSTTYSTIDVDNGTYEIGENHIGFYREGVEINGWDHETCADDFLFQSVWSHDVYGKIGNRIYLFRYGNMIHKVSNVIDYVFLDGYFYAIYMIGDDLYFWSPMFDHFIAEDVDDVALVYGHLLYQKGDLCYAVNALFYNLANCSNGYDEMVPVPSVLLGKGPLRRYSFRLEPSKDKSYTELAADFDRYYGLLRYVWREY